MDAKHTRATHRKSLDYYRVQERKHWWRRKWQAEWPDCRWAQRGYTRTGIRAMVAARTVHPCADAVYVRWQVLIRGFGKPACVWPYSCPSTVGLPVKCEDGDGNE